VTLAQVVAEDMFSNPARVNVESIRMALKHVVVAPKKLNKHFLGRVRKLAFTAAFGDGPGQLQHLHAAAAAMHEHGHFVRIFRWSAEEVKQELMARAKSEYDEAKKKRGAKGPIRSWAEVQQDVNRRCVCGCVQCLTRSLRTVEVASAIIIVSRARQQV
jgi:hypothetical protein